MTPDIFQPMVTAITQNLTQNAGAYLTGFFTTVSLLVLAFIGAMPPQIPKSAQDLWTWIRETLQTATPINRVAQHGAMGVMPNIPEGVAPTGSSDPKITGISEPEASVEEPKLKFSDK